MKRPLSLSMRFLGSVLLAAGLAAFLGACSLFGDSDDPPGTKQAAPPPKQTAAKPSKPPGADEPFPNLASVPGKKPDTTTKQQRLQIQEGLFADRKNARYVDGPVAGVRAQREQVQTGRTVKPVVVQPGSARQVARRQPRQVDGVRIVTSGLVSTVSFGAGETSLPPGSGRIIVRIAQLQRITGGTLSVVGRAASSEGSPSQIRALAVARARAIANGLISLGVQGSKIRVSGSRQPGRSQAAVFISGGRPPRRAGR